MESVMQQRMRWMTFLDSNYGVTTPAKRRKMKSLVRMGVPPELRHRVWRLTTGSYAKEKSAGITYDILLQRYAGVASPFDDQINKDLARTLPSHPRYQTEEAQGALGRLLRTYAMWQPTVGYCQGMNFLCAVLLLIMSEQGSRTTYAVLILYAPLGTRHEHFSRSERRMQSCFPLLGGCRTSLFSCSSSRTHLQSISFVPGTNEIDSCCAYAVAPPVGSNRRILYR